MLLACPLAAVVENAQQKITVAAEAIHALEDINTHVKHSLDLFEDCVRRPLEVQLQQQQVRTGSGRVRTGCERVQLRPVAW